MQVAADELLVELQRTDEMLRDVALRAGQGSGDFEQRLQAQLRRLRSILGTDGAQAAADVMEAAERVLISADPATPMLMLELAHGTLAAVMRREANSTRLRAA